MNLVVDKQLPLLTNTSIVQHLSCYCNGILRPKFLTKVPHIIRQPGSIQVAGDMVPQAAD